MVVSRLLAAVLGAGLFVSPAVAQEAAPPPSASVLTPAETMWHMRAALNVAALACRGADGDETVRLYNAMLSGARDSLAEAAAGTEQAYRARFSAHWQEAQDASMTRLYNFFASQPGHAAFCATAHDVLREAVTVEPSSFMAFAYAALPRLEAPFAVVEARPVVASAAVDTSAVAAVDTGAVPVAIAVAYTVVQR